MSGAVEPVLSVLPGLDLGSALDEPPTWEDPDQLIDDVGPLLRAVVADGRLLSALPPAVASGALPIAAAPRGVRWGSLAVAPGLVLGLRFCPTGSTSAPHVHDRPRVALVLGGGYRQTLYGIGGGVDSSAADIPLYVRQEGPGQLFALAAGQRHASSSTVGSLLLTLSPDGAGELVLADGPPAALARRLRAALEEAGLVG